MILAVLPDAAVVVDEQGTVVATNDHAGDLFGYDQASLVGRPVEVLIPERLRARHRDHRAMFMAAPAVRSMGTDLNLAGRRADGSEFPIDVSLAPIGGDERGLVVAAIRDMTERNAATATRARLAALVQSNQDGIVTLARDCSVTSWNPGATRLFGVDEDTMVGRHVSTLIPDHESEAFEGLLAAADLRQPTQAVDTRWLRVDGTQLDVAVSVSSLEPAATEASGYSLIVRDITQRKETERLLAHRELWLQALADTRLAIVSGADLSSIARVVADQLTGLLRDSLVLLPYDATAGWPDAPPGGGAPGDRAGPPIDGAAADGTPALGLPVGAATLDLLVGTDRQRTGLLTDLLDELPDDSPMLAAALRQAAEGRPPMAVVTAPVSGADGPAGALVVAAPEAVLTPEDAAGVGGLAEQLSLGLRLAQGRQREQQLLLADDRARIARDLHDHVIQALFAAGMRLQSALPLVSDERAAAWVSDIVGELDDTIGRIRTTIFSLETPRDRTAGLRTGVLELARVAAAQLGFDPEVRFTGPVETVPDAVRPHLLAVTREAMSNAARHAAATQVTVDVRVRDGAVAVVVTDNGRGIGEPGRISGLNNARKRAEDLGGGLTVDSGPAGGTVFDWHVPV